MAVLDTATLQESSASQSLDTGTMLTTSFSELDTGTMQESIYLAELDTAVMQWASPIAQTFLDTYVLPDPARWDTQVAGQASQLVLPTIVTSFKIYVGGVETDLSPYLLTLSITRVLGGKTTMSASFLQHSPAGFDSDGYPLPDLFSHMRVKKSDLNPLFLGRNAMANKILSHRFDRTRTAVITLTFETAQGPQVWRAPTLLMGTPALDPSGVLNWGGEGILAMLEKEGSYLTDIVPGDGILNYAHATFRAICASRGITSVTLNFPDYPIRQLRMSSGTPRKWLEEIAEPYQAHIREDGDGLVVGSVGQPLANPKWAWMDYLNIMGLRVEQLEGWKNKFILSRLQDQSSVVSKDNAVQRCVGGQCVGLQSVSVSEPSNFVVIFVKRGASSQLAFKDFQYWDTQGNALSPITQAQSFASAQKIGTITFVSEPYYLGGTQGNTVPGGSPSTTNTSTGNASQNPNMLGQYVPEYEWVIFGGSEASANTSSDPIDAFNQTFSFGAVDAATVALWGEIPEGSALELSVIPNATVGQASVNAFLWENIRRIFQCSWKTPYINPWAHPAEVHQVSHAESSQTQLLWLHEKDVLSMGEDKSWTQAFDMYRGLVM